MHLEPFVAEQLAIGESASINGRIGMHEGYRASLAGLFGGLGAFVALSDRAHHLSEVRTPPGPANRAGLFRAVGAGRPLLRAKGRAERPQ